MREAGYLGAALLLCSMRFATLGGFRFFPPGTYSVRKCCEKGYQLHARETRCVLRPGVHPPEDVHWDVLQRSKDDADAYWLPPMLRRRLVLVNYDALDTAQEKDKQPSLWQRRLGYSVRVEASMALTAQRFLEINSTARRFELDAFKGRVILAAVRRQTFCFEATEDTEMPNVIFTTLELRSVPKCCPKGFQLNQKANGCEISEADEEEDVSEEIIDPYKYPKSANWLPRKMLSSVIVAVYGKKQQLLRWNVAVDANAAVGFEVTGDDEEDDEFSENKRKPTSEQPPDGGAAQWRLREDQAGYSVWVRGTSRTGRVVEGTASEFCFDATADGPLPTRIVLARIWSLPKCCGRHEMLNKTSNAMRCEPHPGASARETDHAGDAGDASDFEDLSAVVADDEHHWVPQRLHGREDMLVEYLPESDRKWIAASQEIPADDESRWRLSLDGDVTKVLINTSSPSNMTVTQRASVYCFDRKASGDRVLLTQFSQINKCCRKDEQLDVRAAKCVARLGVKNDGYDVGVVDPQDEESAFWLPKILRTEIRPVRYDYGLMEKGGVVFKATDNPHWQVDLRARGKTMVSVSSTLFGQSKKVLTDKFCFDVIERGPVALIADVCFEKDFNCFFKCCPSGKQLSREGMCTDNKKRDWSPRVSVAKEYLSSEGLYTAKILSHPICGNISFQAKKAPGLPQEFANQLQGKPKQYRFSKTFVCADFQEGVGEALAYCVAPPIAPTYEAVRPLGVVAVVLLAAALALLLRAPDTRTTTHGRALACHAACLLAANATQAAWFFLDRDDAYCKYYAYAIYFFLVAAGAWLNAISINLARGFKRPLGALAGKRRRGAGSGGGGGGWRRFAFLSAWAWGVAIALTALCVVARMHAKDLGVAAPSLFETRTCFFEVVYSERLRHGRVKETDDLGAVYYFYAPMAVLVVANAACLALTMCSIRSLRRDSDHVQRAGASTAPAVQSAMLYVKLLLTAGVVELGVEGLAWGARQREFVGSSEYAVDFAAESAFVFGIVGTFLDVARAAAVLWLCVGRCSALPGAPTFCACCAWLRRGASRLALRQVSLPSTVSTSVPLETLKDPGSSTATNDSNESARTSTLSLSGSTSNEPA